MVGHTILERIVRVLVLVIMTMVRRGHVRIAIPIRLLRILAVVAVMMVQQIGVHIRLIMVQVHRLGALVIIRPVTVMIR